GLRRILDEAPPAGPAAGSSDNSAAGLPLSSSVRQWLADFRRAIRARPLSDRFTECLAEMWQGPARWVVRSSATAEDLPDRAFAGMYDSFLGVRRFEDLCEKIKCCWASLWSERAYAYRQTHRLNHRQVGMAVLIQPLINAERSGVLFTADPVTGRTDQIVIEGCFGLPAALVAGRIAPDRIVVAKKMLRAVYHTVSAKLLRLEVDSDGSVVERDNPPHLAQRPCLDRRLARRLGRLALRAERRLGGPQDMEWAEVHGRIWLLQSRPITALPERPPAGRPPRQIWTNANAGEVAPDVVSPLTWSIIEKAVMELFRPMMDVIGLDLAGQPLFGLVAGRVYFSVNTGVAILRKLPVDVSWQIHRIFGGDQEILLANALADLRPEDLGSVRIRWLRALLRCPRSLYEMGAARPAKARRYFARIQQEIQICQRQQFSSLTESELLRQMQERFVLTCRYLRGLIFMLQAMVTVPLLNWLCRRWLDDAAGIYANRLLVGSGDLEDVRSGLDLWRLALAAAGDKQVRELIERGDCWDDVGRGLDHLSGGAAFRQAWDAFMRRHGHHCRGEIELFNPRWAETPDYILRIVRGYLAGVGKADPEGAYRRRVQRREQLEEHCRRRLRNPLRRRIFQYVLAQARWGSTFRENIKSEVVRFLFQWRLALLELGRRWQRLNLCEDPQDIFFLTLDEIVALAPEKERAAVGALIRQRRQDYRRNQGICPPKIVVDRFDPDAVRPGAPPPNGGRRTFHGISVSAGVATGKARVIGRGDDRQQVRPGEILVIPFADPGWTPYFIPAAGVVMDLGGMLSHGSIIAREYGIPAVVNVQEATRIIRTGQTIRVDADRGLVACLDEPPAAPGSSDSPGPSS
ncbi:MAG: hypothetical protein JW810_10990, partial [Sedimentisphaerales bacterium]|nr:hypothetical protein [Sedimentisphaerales bacterium]